MAKTTTTSKAAKPKPQEFQAEVARLLDLMVHSVYSQTEIFLRELISNAADACDKLRYEAITKPALVSQAGDFKITITADKKTKTLTVSDNGIGMNESELAENLGTIARSGTKAFLDGLEAAKASKKTTTAQSKPKSKSKGDGAGDITQIGQFGVGFYSAFMVAEKIDVISRRAGEQKCWHWSSDGAGTFTVSEAGTEDAAQCPAGTQVKLSLKKDALDYLEPGRIEQIVRAYSDHIAIPIELIEIDKGKPTEPRQINEARALWMRPKREITPEQYQEFFNNVGGAFGAPDHILHYKAEGRHEYTVLLFVPGAKPFDLFDPDRRGRTRLYVKRVYITDDAVILPAYLRFMRGVVDSEDMPLNISREMLQNNPIVESIGKAVTKRVLNEFKKIAEKKPDDYAQVWENFGAVIKEGLYEDIARRDELLELVRFRTTASKGALRSLKDYIADMKANQTAIYYLAGEDADQLGSSPQLEGFAARGIEVLLLSDPVDHFWTSNVTGYDGKPFKSIVQGEADLDQVAPLEKADQAGAGKVDDSATAALIAALKDKLGDKVAEVRKSDRLTTSAVCLVSPEGGMDKGLQKILAQSGNTALPEMAPVLEINPSHDLITTLAKQASEGGDGLDDAAWLLFDLARVLDGETIEQSHGFADRLSRVMTQALTR